MHWVVSKNSHLITSLSDFYIIIFYLLKQCVGDLNSLHSRRHDLQNVWYLVSLKKISEKIAFKEYNFKTDYIKS
jgi:hypothetical protein